MLLVLLLLSWLLLLLLLLLLSLQLLLMFNTVEALYNIFKHGCDAGGDLCAICFGGSIFFGGLGVTYGGSWSLVSRCGVTYASGLAKFDQVPGEFTLLCPTSTTANAAS